jgi:hypothetical protein
MYTRFEGKCFLQDKGGIKFGEQAVGVNKLSSIMKTMGRNS